MPSRHARTKEPVMSIHVSETMQVLPRTFLIEIERVLVTL